MRPYDSNYWKTVFKGSLESAIGPATFAFTLNGGFIFSGRNRLIFKDAIPDLGSLSLAGNIKGWEVGGDLWATYSLKEDISLPFLLKVEYQTKTRYGAGLGAGTFTGRISSYKNRENTYHLEVGGGVDRKLAREIKIAL